jgi:hypothetical protein
VHEDILRADAAGRFRGFAELFSGTVDEQAFFWYNRAVYLCEYSIKGLSE